MKARKRTAVSTRKTNYYNVKRVEPIMIGSDMQARLFTLAPGDEIPWHRHSECADYYFVLDGALAVKTSRLRRQKTVRPGSHYRIAPGTAHHISNRTAADCRFLLVQGVGRLNWVKVDR